MLNLPLPEIKLSVRSVDLLSSKTGQNRQEHHTDLYHGEELIIRRGQTFQMKLELNRPFNADTDKLHLDLKTGMDWMDSVCACGIRPKIITKSIIYMIKK